MVSLHHSPVPLEVVDEVMLTKPFEQIAHFWGDNGPHMFAAPCSLRDGGKLFKSLKHQHTEQVRNQYTPAPLASPVKRYRPINVCGRPTDKNAAFGFLEQADKIILMLLLQCKEF